MNISTSKNICLEIADTLKLDLTYREAYCLMLFCTGYNWKDEGYATYNGRLITPVVFTAEDASYPEQKVERFIARATLAEPNEVVLILGPLPEQQFSVNRIQLLKMLNYHFRDTVSAFLSLPDVLPTPTAGEFIPTGRVTPEGLRIGLSVGKYMNFVIYEDKENPTLLPLTDTVLFYGNQNLARPAGVSIISFPRAVFIRGYNGKAKDEAIRFRFSDGMVPMAEM